MEQGIQRPAAGEQPLRAVIVEIGAAPALPVVTVGSMEKCVASMGTLTVRPMIAVRMAVALVGMVVRMLRMAEAVMAPSTALKAFASPLAAM